jgi:hypothetical protein
MIYGLYLAGHYQLGWLFPTSIFGSIAIGGALTIILFNYWFKYWIVKVDNPNEFYRRAIRLNMVFKSTAIRIAKKLDVDIYNNNIEVTSFVTLPDIIINKKVKLTQNSIIIDDKIFYWKDIDNFEISPYFTGDRTFFGPTLDLILRFKDNITENFPLRVIKPNAFDFEYQIDKYLENGKKYNT